MSDEKLNEIAVDVKEIKVDVGFLRQQGAVHNHILSEHHKRSTLLEERIRPVEAHVNFMNTMAKFITTSGGVALLIGLLKYFSGWKL